MSNREDRVDAWRWMLLAHSRALTAIESDLSRAGDVSLSHYDVLLELNAAPDRRLRMTELADKAVLSRTRISRLVDELERRGLVTREPCADDGRVTWAAITPEGRRALRNTAPHYLDSIERNFTSLLSATERRAIAEALHRVADHHVAATAERARR